MKTYVFQLPVVPVFVFNENLTSLLVREMWANLTTACTKIKQLLPTLLERENATVTPRLPIAKHVTGLNRSHVTPPLKSCKL